MATIHLGNKPGNSYERLRARKSGKGPYQSKKRGLPTISEDGKPRRYISVFELHKRKASSYRHWRNNREDMIIRKRPPAPSWSQGSSESRKSPDPDSKNRGS